MSDKMVLPVAASDDMFDSSAENVPDVNEEYIHNKYYGKELLTRAEALDLINMLSGEMLADGR